MEASFSALPFHALASDSRFFKPHRELSDRVDESSPAIEVMTDLRQVMAQTVDPETTVDAALQLMINRGVRMLLVTDRTETVRGLISSRDIQGERPLTIMEQKNLHRTELTVRDLMTGRDSIEVLQLNDVLRARVGDIIATLKSVNRQHAMVADTDPDTGQQAIRGIFSLSQIGRQLGLNLDASHQAVTFADLEQALAPA